MVKKLVMCNGSVLLLEGVEAEDAIVSIFHGTDAGTDSPPLRMAGTSSVRKEDAHIFLSIMDLTG